jgi:hypothetical protein
MGWLRIPCSLAATECESISGRVAHVSSWRLAVHRQRRTPASPPPVKPSTPAIGAAPRSTAAIGGRPGRGLVACGPGYPLPPDQFVASPFGRWQANVETMLATLAAKNDAQERRIAALEKLALDRERGTAALNALARAVGELFGVRLP